jgi:hypothetical protein
MLQRRKLLQQLIAMSKATDGNTPLAWDDPLPEKIMNRWQYWKDSLRDLQHVPIPRCYHPKEFGTTARESVVTWFLRRKSGRHWSVGVPKFKALE